MSLDRRLSVLPSVMISVRELGTPTPMVKLLLNAPATFIESIPGKVCDVEGIHDRPRAGEFFGGCAFLNPVNPSIATISMRSRQVSGWEASQVLKTRLEQPWGSCPKAGRDRDGLVRASNPR